MVRSQDHKPGHINTSSLCLQNATSPHRTCHRPGCCHLGQHRSLTHQILQSFLILTLSIFFFKHVLWCWQLLLYIIWRFVTFYLKEHPNNSLLDHHKQSFLSCSYNVLSFHYLFSLVRTLYFIVFVCAFSPDEDILFEIWFFTFLFLNIMFIDW